MWHSSACNYDANFVENRFCYLTGDVDIHSGSNFSLTASWYEFIASVFMTLKDTMCSEYWTYVLITAKLYSCQYAKIHVCMGLLHLIVYLSFSTHTCKLTQLNDLPCTFTDIVLHTLKWLKLKKYIILEHSTHKYKMDGRLLIYLEQSP